MPWMKVERTRCELCGNRAARVFMVVQDGRTAKAHVCLECFEEFQAIPGGTVESVSLQDYQATAEEDDGQQNGRLSR